MPKRKSIGCKIYNTRSKQQGCRLPLVPAMALVPFLAIYELHVMLFLSKTLYQLYLEPCTKQRWWRHRRCQALSLSQQNFVRKLCDIDKFVDIPKHVTHLRLTRLPSWWSSFLPSTLIYLKLPMDFNAILGPNDLPSSLHELHLCGIFNQPLCFLPPDLRVLTTFSRFDQHWTNICLPSSLQKLLLGFFFNPPDFPSSWPCNLTVLECYRWNHALLGTQLPSSLHTLRLFEFSCPVIRLPQTLRILELSSTFNHPLDHLPPLTELTINIDSNINFPVTLETLRLGNRFLFDLEGRLPISLCYLSFCCYANKSRFTSFPPNLQTINGQDPKRYLLSPKIKS